MSARRRIALSVAAALLPAAAAAQSFPSKPIRIVVPYQAGGTSEMMARQVADQLQQVLKQPVVIENRPGGGTTIGATSVAQAPADGHSLFVNASSFLINAHLMKGLAYDAWKDFTPITLAASNPHLLVAHTGVGTPTFKEFLPLAKQKGGAMSYASFGNGSSGHLAFELLKKTYDFPMQHVPYKGVPQAMTDVMAGQVQAMLTDLPPGAVQVKAGKMLGLAIAAEKRSPTVPEVGTFQELTGTRFVSRSWFGFLVRAGTSPEIVKTLQSEIVKALQNPGVKEKLNAAGMDTIASTQEEFIAFMKSESDRFAEAIRFSGAKID